MRRVLVCGGRSFNDGGCVYYTLDTYHAEHKIGVLILGVALGADRLAGEWAWSRGVPQEA